MGTTATIAAVVDSQVSIVHVGDSRAYLFRAGVLRQLSRDDRLVTDLLEAGRLTPAEVATFPHRNVVTRVLGPTEIVGVWTTSRALRAGDRLLLCTDGLTELVDDRAIADLLATHADPETLCRALVEAADRAGGRDNETVVVMTLDG
jgi:PPM family protein phosphatase